MRGESSQARNIYAVRNDSNYVIITPTSRNYRPVIEQNRHLGHQNRRALWSSPALQSQDQTHTELRWVQSLARKFPEYRFPRRSQRSIPLWIGGKNAMARWHVWGPNQRCRSSISTRPLWLSGNLLLSTAGCAYWDRGRYGLRRMVRRAAAVGEGGDRRWEKMARKRSKWLRLRRAAAERSAPIRQNRLLATLNLNFTLRFVYLEISSEFCYSIFMFLFRGIYQETQSGWLMVAGHGRTSGETETRGWIKNIWARATRPRKLPFQVPVAGRSVNRVRFLVTTPGDIRSEKADMSNEKSCGQAQAQVQRCTYTIDCLGRIH